MEHGKAVASQFSLANLFFLFMLVALSAMSYVPSPDQISLYVFLTAYGLFGAWAFTFSGWWRKVRISSFFWVLAVLFFILINMLVALNNDIELSKWVRSFVPIAFFVTLLWVPFYIRELGVRRVFVYFLLSCVTYCIFLVVFNHSKFIEFAHTGGRLTFYLQDSVVPYPFIGVIIATCLPGLKTLTRVGFILFFLVFVIAVGYKLQLLFLAGFFVFSALHYPGILRRILLCFGMLLASICVVLIAGEYIAQRLSSIGGGGDEVRLLEIKYAVSVFIENPLFGGGLGLNVPLDQTRPAYADIKSLWESDSVSYIHNFPFYLLMVGGVSFFLPFVYLVISAGIFQYRCYISKNGYLKTSVWGALGLFTFFMTSAAHKQIQCVIAISLFICIYREMRAKGRLCLR